MAILKSDLTRNFSIGFIVGALIVSAMSAQSWSAQFANPAQAATSEVVVEQTQ